MIKAGSVVRVTHNDGFLFLHLGIVESMTSGDFSRFMDIDYYLVRFCKNGCHMTFQIPANWTEVVK